MPEHVNVNTIEMMATMQAFNAFAVHREYGAVGLAYIAVSSLLRKQEPIPVSVPQMPKFK